MEYSRLGNSDLTVSRIGFGCEPLGGTDWGQVDDDAAVEAVSKALDLGINFFDTADVYGLGRSEELLAKALGDRRQEVIIATKGGVAWEAKKGSERARTFRDSSAAHITKSVEESLRRLRLECIPLYMVHWPDARVPMGETMQALVRCKQAGKIRQIGVSNFPAPLIREAHAISPLAAVELQYSLIDRKCEADVLPCCLELEIGVVTYGSLAQGLLTGKYTEESHFGKDDRRRLLPHFQAYAIKQNLRKVERLRRIGSAHQRSAAQVAIRWALMHNAVSCVITGAKTPTQIMANVGAIGFDLTRQEAEYLAAEAEARDPAAGEGPRSPKYDE